MPPFRPDAPSALLQRLRAVPKPALAGAALLCACALVGVAAAFWPSPSEPAFTIAASEGADDAGQAGRGQGETGSSDSQASDDAQDADGQASPAPAGIAVYVSGAVASPGVYTLAEGARACDAVEAAGGLREDASADSVNLARKLADGEQLAIPTQEQAASGAASQAGGAAVSDVGAAGSSAQANAALRPVNINTAGLEELDSLSGVGPATAQAIIDEREANGPFSSIEDIQRVSGIGEKKFEKLKAEICV